MNVALWILQAFLALHTAIGAGWKLFNSEQAVPTLAATPNAVWVALIPFELLCAVGLAIPAVAPSRRHWVGWCRSRPSPLQWKCWSSPALTSAPGPRITDRCTTGSVSPPFVW